jgi:1-acyl-sn-glycerol-3-phosphate acyltransferase
MRKSGAGPHGRKKSSQPDDKKEVRELIRERAQTDWSVRGANPEFMKRIEPFVDFTLDRYFQVETSGWEHLPSGPCLLAGVHSGTWLTMDAWSFVLSWWRQFGPDRILHGTAHDALMAFPGVGPFFRNVGVIPASREPVTAALAAGNSVIVWPGGEVDAMRSWRRRNEVVLGGRRGFVKQAIASGVPIVPVATIGGANTVFVLSEGRWLAKLLQLKKRVRSENAPIVAGLPFGIWVELLPSHIPLPAKIVNEILDPIPVSNDPKAIEDCAYVDEIYGKVERAIQTGVDRLTARRGKRVRSR